MHLLRVWEMCGVMTGQFSTFGWPLLACLAGAACVADDPAPILFLNVEDAPAIKPSPELSREARLAGALEAYCIDPLPETGDIRRAIAATGWRVPDTSDLPEGPAVPEPTFAGDAPFGRAMIEREGAIGDLSLSVGLYGAGDAGGDVVTCAIEADGIDGPVLADILRRRGHVGREPIAEMAFPPSALTAWHLASRRGLEKTYTLSLETNSQDGQARLAISD